MAGYIYLSVLLAVACAIICTGNCRPLLIEKLEKMTAEEANGLRVRRSALNRNAGPLPNNVEFEEKLNEIMNDPAKNGKANNILCDQDFDQEVDTPCSKNQNISVIWFGKNGRKRIVVRDTRIFDLSSLSTDSSATASL